MEIKFDGKRALVTGAGKGIGRATCIRLVKLGAFVVGVSRTQEDLNSLKEELDLIRENSCLMIAADIGIAEEARRAAEEAGDIDLLVNNAAVTNPKPFLEYELGNWQNHLNVNLTAPFIISQVIARGMVIRGSGAIVNVSSTISCIALEDHVGYCSTKGGLDQMTRVLALELGKHNIRVNSVNPTVVLTPMGLKVWSDPEKANPMMDKIPLHRFAEAEEVVDSIMFLLSDKASMINGVCLPIDGGLLTH